MFEETREILVELPESLENLKLPSPQLLAHYRDLRDRIVWVDAPIDESLMETVKQILAWNREDRGVPKAERKPIRMLVNSPGGDLDATLSCFDVMLASETPITTVNMGNAMSGGLLLLIAGEKRYCLKNSTALLHNGSTSIGGTASQAKATMDYYKSQLATLTQIILDRTAIDAKLYKKRQNDEWYFSGQDQVKYGIVDEMVQCANQLLFG